MKEMIKHQGTIIPAGDVKIQKVTAKYVTKTVPVLKDLSLVANAGEKIGIVGRTGAGKTSLIKLFWQCL